MTKQKRIILSMGAIAALAVPTVIAATTLTNEELKNNKVNNVFGTQTFTQYSSTSINLDSKKVYASPTGKTVHFPLMFEEAKKALDKLNDIKENIKDLEAEQQKIENALKTITDATKKATAQQALDITKKDKQIELDKQKTAQEEYDTANADAWQSETAAIFEDLMKNARMTKKGQNFRKASEIAVEINRMQKISEKLKAFKETTGIDFPEFKNGVRICKFEIFSDPDGTLTINMDLKTEHSTTGTHEVHGTVLGDDNETVVNHNQPINIKAISDKFKGAKFKKNIVKKNSEIIKEINEISGVEAKLIAIEKMTGIHLDLESHGTEITKIELTDRKDGTLDALFTTSTDYATTSELMAKVSIKGQTDAAIDKIREEKQKAIEAQRRAALPPVDHTKEDRQKFMAMIALASAGGLLFLILMIKLIHVMFKKRAVKKEIKRAIDEQQ
ncbi:hypothetical protein [Mycoplasma todarodis]|uniref:hypothetical protein n=1 Tax=Mycoplasma todarodis TaxID=1937191 RepID=UPI003B2E273B